VSSPILIRAAPVGSARLKAKQALSIERSSRLDGADAQGLHCP
jgi:hypothetical protein